METPNARIHRWVGADTLVCELWVGQGLVAYVTSYPVLAAACPEKQRVSICYLLHEPPRLFLTSIQRRSNEETTANARPSPCKVQCMHNHSSLT